MRAKKPVAAILFAISLLLGGPRLETANAADPAFDLRRVDHQQHLTVSYGMTLTGYAALNSITSVTKAEAILISAATALAIGYSKEAFYDKEFGVGDLKADAIGVAGGMMVPLVFHF